MPPPRPEEGQRRVSRQRIAAFTAELAAELARLQAQAVEIRRTGGGAAAPGPTTS